MWEEEGMEEGDRGGGGGEEEEFETLASDPTALSPRGPAERGLSD